MPHNTQNAKMSSSDQARVRVENVGKVFGKRLNASRKLVARAMMKSFFRSKRERKKSDEDFWALSGVNIHINHGESVAIIGSNGAGKSTLLRIMAGHLRPDEGTVTTRGNVAELTAMTAGYQANLSGRENIFLAGALRGFRQSEMLVLCQDIIDFSELEPFIDAPFGTYSAGMKMRLAFAVASHAKPDILFIDEALAVGDLRFRNKCLGRLHSMKLETTFILVTHSLSSVTDFCERTIVLDKGHVIFDGPSKAGVDAYQALNDTYSEVVSVGPHLKNLEKISVRDAKWVDSQGEKTRAYAPKDDWHFKFSVTVKTPIEKLLVSVMIYDNEGNEVVSLSDPANTGFTNLQPETEFYVKTHVKNPQLLGHKFSTVLVIRDGPELIYRKTVQTFSTLPKTERMWGLLRLQSSWSITAEGSNVAPNQPPPIL